MKKEVFLHLIPFQTNNNSSSISSNNNKFKINNNKYIKTGQISNQNFQEN